MYDIIIKIFCSVTNKGKVIKMKKTVLKSALALILVCASVFCFASCGNSAAKVEDAESADGSFAGISWDYDAKDKTLTIEGSGIIGFESASDAAWFDVRHSVEKIVFDTDEITEIGDYAFYNMKSLEEVNIPDSVEALGDYAFAYCASLTSIDGQLPLGLKTIGEGCFESCISLEAISVPSTVSSIGARAFAHCAALKTVDISATLTKIESWTFKGCKSIDKLTMFAENREVEVASDAFENCAVSWTSGVHFSSARDGRFALTIKYVYEDGTEAAPSYVEEMSKNDHYEKTSPSIEGYEPDEEKVDGYLTEDKEIIVTYTEIVEETEAEVEEEQAEGDDLVVEEEPKSKASNIFALVFMGVVILAIIGLVIFMAISNKKSTQKNNKNNKNGKKK